MKKYFLFLLIISTRLFSQSLFINEFMASNTSTITDPDYNTYSDWIEIYNPGTSPVNLKNYYITDDLSAPSKYKFLTDIIIQPNSYTLIWADDKNINNHANFKLSASGEGLGIYSPTLTPIDTLTFSSQSVDISEGRFPNGSNTWYKFSPATPGSANLSSGINNLLSSPVLSLNSGFYHNSISVTISHPVQTVELRYTRDGSIPVQTSTLYTSPVLFDSTSVIRVKAFKSGYVPSRISSATYFINETINLPVFSLMTDPANFFSDTSGIYVEGTNGITGNCSTSPRNWNQDWERPVSIELFEKDRSKGFKVDCGVKIFGGCSRIYPMKSLAFYLRSDYGNDKLKYRLFDNLPLTEYNNFLLRSSGQDWWRTMFRDGMAHTILSYGMKLDVQAYRPSVVFLNGNYWGIHNIREKINEHYIYYHHGADKDNLDLIEMSKSVSANLGDTVAYYDMINFLTNNNMALEANYNYIKSIVDIDNYLDYQIAQIYAANGDWPGANMKLWRERTASGKWRWIVYDLDFTYGGNAQGQYNTNTLTQATATNGPNWPNPPWSTLMFRKLLENTGFKNEFIQRFAAHMNNTFDSLLINNTIDSMQALISAEIPRHKVRWVKSITMGNDWHENIQLMKDFANKRPKSMRGFIQSKFSLSGIDTLIISKNKNWGKIFTNSVEVKKDNEKNIFFRNIPVSVSALPLPGYKFKNWQGISSSSNPEISVQLNGNGILTAIFEKAPVSSVRPVINEINYKSYPLFDTEDWIEIYNPSDSEINLTDWKFRDNNIAEAFRFPSNTKIGAKSYLVIVKDKSKFKSLYPNDNNIIGDFSFGLSSDGEKIQLLDNFDNIIDDVEYSGSGNWPVTPNGNGPTLSLINPEFDNSLAKNWKASERYGTPNRLNDVYTKISENKVNFPFSNILTQNYPNPFNPTTRISYSLKDNSFVTLKVYDLLGKEVALLLNENQNAGNYTVNFSGNTLSAGTYFYELRAGSYREIKKMLLLK